MWVWMAPEDPFPNTTNPKAYSALDKFSPSGSVAPINCLKASWPDRYAFNGGVSVWAWMGEQCSKKLPFMCKRKRGWPGLPGVLSACLTSCLPDWRALISPDT